MRFDLLQNALLHCTGTNTKPLGTKPTAETTKNSKTTKTTKTETKIITCLKIAPPDSQLRSLVHSHAPSRPLHQCGGVPFDVALIVQLHRVKLEPLLRPAALLVVLDACLARREHVPIIPADDMGEDTGPIRAERVAALPEELVVLVHIPVIPHVIVTLESDYHRVIALGVESGR